MASVEYLIELGAPTERASLELVLREILRGCQTLDVEPLTNGQLVQIFPESATLAFFRFRSPQQTVELYEDVQSLGLMSHRHTPTALLRRIVALTANRFGVAQLLVRHCDTALRSCRAASTTLAGFLRSGSVIQDDLLLSVVSRPQRRRRSPVLARRLQRSSSRPVSW